MRLDRNQGDGRGKYALVRLREVKEGSEADDCLKRLAELGHIDFGRRGEPDEFFVTKLCDWNAHRTLIAYAEEAETGGADPELAADVREMAARSGPYSPFCKRPD